MIPSATPNLDNRERTFQMTEGSTPITGTANNLSIEWNTPLAHQSSSDIVWYVIL